MAPLGVVMSCVSAQRRDSHLKCPWRGTAAAGWHRAGWLEEMWWPIVGPAWSLWAQPTFKWALTNLEPRDRSNLITYWPPSHGGGLKHRWTRDMLQYCIAITKKNDIRTWDLCIISIIISCYSKHVLLCWSSIQFLSQSEITKAPCPPCWRAQPCSCVRFHHKRREEDRWTFFWNPPSTQPNSWVCLFQSDPIHT